MSKSKPDKQTAEGRKEVTLRVMKVEPETRVVRVKVTHRTINLVNGKIHLT